MTTAETTPTAATKQPEPKTVANDMPMRRVFESVAAAQEYLAACAETYADWGDDKIPFAAVAIDSEGTFDPAVYTSDMDVMVAKLTNRSKEVTTVKAIVVSPIPKLDLTSVGSDALRDWVSRIMQKEMNHVAVRALREAEDITTVIDQIPTTAAGFMESGRAGAGIMESFNALYKQINATMSAKLPVWAKYRLIKTELKRAMESKGYATEIYAALEDYKGQSLFVVAAQLGISAAKRKGLDPAIFERWLANRDAKLYDSNKVDEDEDDLDIGSLTDSLLEDDKTDEAATDATDEAPATEETAQAVDSTNAAA